MSESDAFSRYARVFTKIREILRNSRPELLISQGIMPVAGKQHCIFTAAERHPEPYRPLMLMAVSVQAAPSSADVVKVWGPTLTTGECAAIRGVLPVPAEFVDDDAKL